MAPPCQYISSVYILDEGGTGGFEFGYVEGTSSCDGNFYTKPRFFYWSYTLTGAVDCGVLSTYVAGDGSYHSLRGSDVNGDTVWGGWLDGVELQPGAAGVDLDFTAGGNQVAMERGGDQDQDFARWNYVKEYHVTGGVGDWSYWDAGSCGYAFHETCHEVDNHTFYVD